MPSTPLTDAINALTAYSNTVTGASDTTLSDAVETLVDGYGSGGGGLTLLDTITADGTTNHLQIDIDADWFTNADDILLMPELTASASDWLYCAKDATSSNIYTVSKASFGPEYLFMMHKGQNGKYAVSWFNHPESSGSPTGYNDVVSYIYLYLYNSSHILTGSVKVYGITL